MKVACLGGLIVSTLLLASPAAAEVRITIDNGHVSMSATNATVREILAEWAKVGQTKIVNAERVTGGPLTLELANISEGAALEIILRSVSGYLLAPRPVATPNSSKYDRILIVPTSNPVRAAIAAPAFSPMNSGPPRRTEPETEPDNTPDEPAPGPPNVAPAARPPVFNSFPQPPAQPQPQPASPPPASVPTAMPSAPAGVAVPGMMMPTPQPQPGQPSPGNPE